MKNFLKKCLVCKISLLPALAVAPFKEEIKFDLAPIAEANIYVDSENYCPKGLSELVKKYEKDSEKNISSKGARGPYQFMPATWREFSRKVYGKSLPFSSADHESIAKPVAEEYFLWLDEYMTSRVEGLEERTGKRIHLTIIGWNYGPNATLEAHLSGEDFPTESRNLASKVLHDYFRKER